MSHLKPIHADALTCLKESVMEMKQADEEPEVRDGIVIASFKGTLSIDLALDSNVVIKRTNSISYWKSIFGKLCSPVRQQ